MRARRSGLLRSLLVHVAIRPTPGITLANRSLNPPEAQCALGSLPDWIASGVVPTGTGGRAALWRSRKHGR
jgi:hypothetical protein